MYQVKRSHALFRFGETRSRKVSVVFLVFAALIASWLWCVLSVAISFSTSALPAVKLGSEVRTPLWDKRGRDKFNLWSGLIKWLITCKILKLSIKWRKLIVAFWCLLKWWSVGNCWSFRELTEKKISRYSKLHLYASALIYVLWNGETWLNMEIAKFSGSIIKQKRCHRRLPMEFRWVQTWTRTKTENIV